MAEIKEVKQILLDPDGSATYERRRERTQEGEAPVSRLMEAMRVRASDLIPERGGMVLLPPKCRFHFASGDRQVFVVEDEPSVRTVSWKTLGCDGSAYDKTHERLQATNLHTLWGESKEVFARRLRTQEVFSLSFPYLVRCYLFSYEKLEKVTLWYGTKPLSSERSDLLIPNLPNRHLLDGALCCSDYARALRVDVSVTATVDLFEAEFWGSPWNNHWSDGFFKYAEGEPMIASPWEWERATHVDPTFTLRMKWFSQGRTIGQEVRRLLNTSSTQKAEDAFAFFEKRIRAADPWDAAAPKPVETELAPADSTSLMLKEGRIIQIGDKITLPPTLRLPGMSRDEQYEIEWFTRVDPIDQGRRVKLKGFDPLVRIIHVNCLVDDVRVTQVAETSETVLLGGIELKSGCYCRLDPQEYPAYRGLYCSIASVRSIGRGAVTVKFRDCREYVVIAENGVLFSGIELIPFQEIDQSGSLKARSITVPDGTVLSVGDAVLCTCNDTRSLHRIEGVIKGFRPPSVGDLYIALLLSDGTKVPYWQGKRTVFLLSEYTQETEVLVGGQRLAVGSILLNSEDSISPVRTVTALLRHGTGVVYAQFAEKPSKNWYCLSTTDLLEKPYTFAPSLVIAPTSFTLGDTTYTTEDLFQSSSTGEFLRFSHFNEGSEVGAVVGYSGEIKHSLVTKFKLVKNLVRVNLFLRLNDEFTLMRGMRIRLTRSVYEDARGKRFIISHFFQDENKRNCLVTAKGHVFPVDQGLFYVRYANTWHAIPMLNRETEWSGMRITMPLVSPARLERSLRNRFSKPLGTPLGVTDRSGTEICMGDYVIGTDEYYGFVQGTPSAILRLLTTSPRRVVHVSSDNRFIYIDAETENTAMAELSEEKFSTYTGYKTLPVHLQRSTMWRSRVVLAVPNTLRIVRP